MTNISTPITYQQEKQTLKNVWFTMTVVALILLMIGFSAGYLIGFNAGQEINQATTTTTTPTETLTP